ncbi:sulfite exporter TauE/SafE family protein [Gellertiella hungarica]|uniref:Probable membrane transporter protein n=1 Tax=Gellertiella hungarica TaxID=1572859 RepID=A0A7W6NLJ3_9HYPH|nr:sulfite exporter TauE/SafE family protein [Gellertiella hungarica]MBB4065377.1 hypothetical protein [Gellertiella hungarica]
MLAAIASGGAVGFMLGLVGGGGSILATPLLLYGVGVRDPHVAIGTSALAVALNAYVNLAAHALKGHVRWKCGSVFAGIGVLGTLAGSTLGKWMDGHALLFLFGLLMLAIGALMLRPRSATARLEASDTRTCLRTGALALATGAASGFFGIGGGFLIVPALMFATGMSMINAVGTSLLSVGTFGLATAANYAHSGLIDWPVAAEFVAGGAAGGTAGMLLATRLAGMKSVLNRILALLILLVGAYVLWKSGLELMR